MHYRGLLRVARREGGTRVYAVRDPAPAATARRSGAASDAECFDALVDIVIRKYAPLPAASLGQLLSLLCHGVPQWKRQRAAALARARQRHPHARLAGVDWYWPAGELPASRRWQADDKVRLLTPFDPVVWDRRRFTLLWSWEYRFEAYTPAPRRKLGYYALPLLWREQVIGWANLSVAGNRLRSELGFVSGSAPTGPAFRTELAAELARVSSFLNL